MYSLIGTAKLNGIDPEAYLSLRGITHFAEHPIKRIDELLPTRPGRAVRSTTDRRVMPKRTPPSRIKFRLAAEDRPAPGCGALFIWRRLIVPEELHQVAKARSSDPERVRLWTNGHRHEFIISVEYAYPDPDGADELGLVDETKIVLLDAQDSRRAASTTSTTLAITGTSRRHAIVEDRPIQPSPTSLIYCSTGENACPPEDVGRRCARICGVPPVLADPEYEEHKHLVSWSGGNFDPKRFDLDPVNRAIAKLKI